MENFSWYSEIIKPVWAPPYWLFGPVWTILYILIILSFGAIFIQVARKKLQWTVGLPFFLNIIFNLVFIPIQNTFPPGDSLSWLATVDIFLVLGTLIWGMVMVWTNDLKHGKYGPKTMRWVILANTPYLLWVTFATVLQITITIIN